VHSTVMGLISLRNGSMSTWEVCAIQPLKLLRLVGLVFRLLATLFELMIYAIIRVTWWDRQVAELRADLGAARVVGSKTVVDALHKLEFQEEIFQHIRATSLRREPRLAEALMSTFRLVPERARMLAKLRTANAELQSDFDATHPSGKDRVAVVEQSQGIRTTPAEWLTYDLLTRLDSELQRLGEPLYRAMIELSRQSEARHYLETTPPWLRPETN
jgi:Zn-dependent protease with chaperone function